MHHQHMQTWLYIKQGNCRGASLSSISPRSQHYNKLKLQKRW